MPGEFNIQFCSHCGRSMKCWWTGLETLFHSCEGCRSDECEVMTVQVVHYGLCERCNWTYEYPEDWYGHA